MTLEAREGDAEGRGEFATVVTSFCVFCGVKASKATRRGGADAVPKMSLGSRSRYPVRGMVRRPEPTNCSEGYWPS